MLNSLVLQNCKLKLRQILKNRFLEKVQKHFFSDSADCDGIEGESHFLHGLDCVVVKILCVWVSLLPWLLVLVGSDNDDE